MRQIFSNGNCLSRQIVLLCLVGRLKFFFWNFVRKFQSVFRLTFQMTHESRAHGGSCPNMIIFWWGEKFLWFFSVFVSVFCSIFHNSSVWYLNEWNRIKANKKTVLIIAKYKIASGNVPFGITKSQYQQKSNLFNT